MRSALAPQDLPTTKIVSKGGYVKLLQTGESSADEDPRHEHEFLWQKVALKRLLLTSVSLLCLLPTLGFAWICMRWAFFASRTDAFDPGYCGKNASEAKLLGCQFSLLTISWSPPHCHDESSSEEYRQWVHSADRKVRSFPYFFDDEGKWPVEDEEALSNHLGPLWTTREEHLGHCAFLQRLYFRAWLENRHLPEIMTGEHMAHCTEELTKELEGYYADLHLVDTPFGINYETCVKPGSKATYK
ncbi:hypothetical protein AC579_8213 [Pseudocercospora musae]|uniref:Uncharacterized protein n=1 Tax=Pseudocercospora musae TaxID=113226 RepID=A0A139IVI8_9PEZI|nr:hypothetical protein AC579_8213 [Pseudocercospora musae]